MLGRGTRAAVSIIPLGSCSCGGSAGRTAAAAGSGWTCWLSQERSAPPPSRVLCCRLCLTSQGKKKSRHGKKWPYTLLFPPGRLAASATGAAQEELLLRLSPRTLSAPLAANFGAGPECAAEGRSAGLGVCFLRFPPPSSGQARRRRRLDVQLDRESLCTPLAADFGPGGGCGGGALSCTGVCLLRFLPPTPGLARTRRGRRTGTQLDGEFALHASRRRLRAWPGGGGRTESLLSTPPAVVFGPGSEGAAAGRAAGDISFYASHRRLWAWPWGGRRRGAQLDGEFAVYASRLQLGFHGCNKICCF